MGVTYLGLFATHFFLLEFSLFFLFLSNLDSNTSFVTTSGVSRIDLTESLLFTLPLFAGSLTLSIALVRVIGYSPWIASISKP